MKYRVNALFLSDLHLGTNACNVDLIVSVLKYFDPEIIVLNGDIIDFWQLSHSRSWTKDHNNILRIIFKLARDGKKIIYCTGNHDEILREYTPFSLDNIYVVDRYEYNSEYNRILFVHGDAFDFVIKSNKWLAKIGSIAYDFLIVVNSYFNRLRKIIGMDYWSLSKYLKTQTKKRIGILQKFDTLVAEYAKDSGFNKISVGHIHIPEYKTIDDILYINTGDMCETGSFLIETVDGELQLITDFVTWKKSN
jgi:UDP-2,3-diacylglucosamine pyrophosphatase LpxH